MAPYQEETGEGNGFTFGAYRADLLLETVQKAREVYLEHPDRWNAMILRDMERDVSWNHSANLYQELYEELKG